MGNCNCKSAPHQVNASAASSPGPISERPPDSSPRSPTRKGRIASILRGVLPEEQSPNTTQRRQRPRRHQDQAEATLPSPLADAQQQQQSVSFLPTATLQPSDASSLTNVFHTTNTAPSSSTNNQPSAPAAATSSNNESVSSNDATTVVDVFDGGGNESSPFPSPVRPLSWHADNEDGDVSPHCQFCGECFDNTVDCDEHEDECIKNPENCSGSSGSSVDSSDEEDDSDGSSSGSNDDTKVAEDVEAEVEDATSVQQDISSEALEIMELRQSLREMTARAVFAEKQAAALAKHVGSNGDDHTTSTYPEAIDESTDPTAYPRMTAHVAELQRKLAEFEDQGALSDEEMMYSDDEEDPKEEQSAATARGRLLAESSQRGRPTRASSVDAASRSSAPIRRSLRTRSLARTAAEDKPRDLSKLTFTLHDGSGDASRDVVIDGILADMLFPQVTEQSLSFARFQVKPRYLDLVRDFTSQDFYHTRKSEWNRVGKKTLEKACGCKDVIDKILRDLIQMDEATLFYVLMFLKCPLKDFNIEAYTAAPGRQLDENQTWKAVRAINAAIPTTNINHQNELNARPIQPRIDCERTICKKHCERVRQLEVDDKVKIIYIVNDYCRDMNVPLAVLGFGGTGVSSFFNQLNAGIIFGIVARGGPHPSRINSFYPADKTAENAIIKTTNWVAPVSFMFDYFLKFVVSQRCAERGITNYTPPTNTILDVLSENDMAPFVKKGLIDADTIANALNRMSQQGRNGLCAAASKVVGYKITNPSEAGKILGRLLTLASDAVVSGTAGCDERQRVLNRACTEKHLELVVKKKVVYRSIYTPTLAIKALVSQGFDKISEVQIWSAAGLRDVPKHPLFGCIDVNEKTGKLTQEQVGWHGSTVEEVEASQALLRSVNIGVVAGGHWTENILANTGSGYEPDTSDMYLLRLHCITELVKSVQDKTEIEQVKKAMSKAITIYKEENTAASSVTISVVGDKIGKKSHNKNKRTIPYLYGKVCSQFLLVNSSSDCELMFGGKGQGNSKKGLAHVILQILEHCYTEEFENTEEKKKGKKKKKVLKRLAKLWNGDDSPDSDSD